VHNVDKVAYTGCNYPPELLLIEAGFLRASQARRVIKNGRKSNAGLGEKLGTHR
jgi:hypothetical protein